MEKLARLIISRKDERDIKFRETIVTLDGKEIANLKFGESVERDVQVGSHVLQGTNRMFKTPEVEITLAAGEVVTFATGNIPNGCFGFLMILQMAPPSIFLQRTDGA